MRRLKEDTQGATLVLVIFGLLISSIAIIGFQTAIVSFATRNYVQHYEKQAYLNARGVATAVATMLEDDSKAAILALDPEVRQAMNGLSDELKTASTVPLSLSTQQLKLLDDIVALPIDDEIDLGVITLNDTPDDLNVGKTTATIARTSENKFYVEAKSTVHKDQDEVKVYLDVKFYEGGSEEDDKPVPEITSDWNGFYSDFGIGFSSRNDTIKNVPHSSAINVGIPWVLNTTNGFINSKNSIYLSGGRTGGSIISQSDIYLHNLSRLSEAPTKISTPKDIHLLDDVEVSLPIVCDTLIISGNNVTLRPREISYAKNIIISGDDVTIQGQSFYCENLMITGDNAVISTITVKNDTILDCKELNLHTLRTGSLSINSKSTTSITWSTFYTSTGMATFDGKSISGQGKEGTFTYNVKQGDVPLYDILPIESVPPRTKPTWADYTNDDVVTLTSSPSTANKLGAGYYTFAEDSLPTVIRTETMVIDKQTHNVDMKWHKLVIDDSTAVQSVDRCIVIPDGQNIEITSPIYNNFMTCFILEGNAKLRIQGQNDIRVYSEPPKQSLFDEVQSRINSKISSVIGNASEQDFGLTEDKLIDIRYYVTTEVMDDYEYQLPVLYTEGKWGNNSTINGTVSVAYVKAIDGGIDWHVKNHDTAANSLFSMSVSALDNTPSFVNNTSGGNTYPLFKIVEYGR